MRSFLLVLTALTLCAAAPPARPEAVAALEAFQRALFEATAPAVVFIAADGGLGSGFIVKDDGLILTNAHVVGRAATVEVILHDGRKLAGLVIERAENLDLALVRVGATGLPTLRLASGEPVSVGAWVAAVGHGEGGAWTFTTGMVSNIYPKGAARPVFQTQIPLNPGSSGGPVLNSAGKVVGIVTAGMSSAQAINFAIPSDVALRSLRGLEPVCSCLIIQAPAGVPIYVDGQSVGAGPRVVEPVADGEHKVFAVIGGRKVEAVVRSPGQAPIELK